jgi:protein disulfide-isomerase A1
MLNDKVWPAFSIAISASKWPMSQTVPLTPKSIRAFVLSQQSGDLDPSIKSEERPKDNNGPVTIVVGNTFKEIVLDRSKNVFITFYAPWWYV